MLKRLYPRKDEPVSEDNRLTRRQVLGLLAAPLAAPIISACGSDALFSPTKSSFTPALGATGSVTLIGAGDQHAQLVNTAHKTGRMVKAVLDADPNAVAFAIGDLVPNGTEAEYRNYDNAWGAFRARTYFAMGNHDHITVPSGTPYYDYVGNRGGARGKGWHAVTLGAWRCYFLNSEMAKSAEQIDWLTHDLAEWSGHHIMAMWHSPMFASVCAHHGKAMVLPPVGVWWKLLQDHGAEFVASGHVHRWERFPRMLRDGTASSRGIRQFIMGTGGVKNMDILTVHPRSERQVISRGIVQFELHADHYAWKLTDTAGVVRDSGTQMCRKTVTV